jgi:hypothetical protein
MSRTSAVDVSIHEVTPGSTGVEGDAFTTPIPDIKRIVINMILFRTPVIPVMIYQFFLTKIVFLSFF